MIACDADSDVKGITEGFSVIWNIKLFDIVGVQNHAIGHIACRDEDGNQILLITAFILVGRQRKLSVYNRVYKYALVFGKLFDAFYKVYYIISEAC